MYDLGIHVRTRYEGLKGFQRVGVAIFLGEWVGK